MKVCLDTSAYTAMMRGHPEVSEEIRRCERVLVSVVVMGELAYGFRCGTRYKENREQLRSFLDSPHVELLTATRDTADRFGRVAMSLRQKGRPIPTNDIWIAAHALEAGAELLTADRHFEEVDGLALVRFAL